MLIANSLSKSFKLKQVVNGISLCVKKSQVVGLLGANGAGKTTTFHILVGLTQGDNGNVILEGVDITKKAVYQRARLGLGYLPQEASIFRKLTVEENLWAVLDNMSISIEEKLSIFETVVDELKIRPILNNMAYTLSGGERRRVEIGRCLAFNPKIILLDEPFAGIDPLAILELQKMILHLKEKGIGILITDHNVRDTLKICDYAYLLHQGKVYEEGTRETIATSESAKKVYLGESFKLDH